MLVNEALLDQNCALVALDQSSAVDSLYEAAQDTRVFKVESVSLEDFAAPQAFPVTPAGVAILVSQQLGHVLGIVRSLGFGFGFGFRSLDLEFQ